ncbi:mechanosensitive ion channel family protein [Zobellia galactanivorans]|uniref:Small-conductance mechanosensitive channel n=1 Tax=Zobellia galactanivorans (strain DSM 12802 / CCUG 47099 / CIP 106680 / NCIMB 13871 / Dsij) TaxID=63186 RepID=G0LCI9_ZOBGA|nr:MULTISPECIES: mechanosensitive ion channel family protein [Zobellia]MBU3025417.1 mechanosensitive ion channel family protein [Zobellia galactanivorans]MDO6810367.1 mechanosensitive ion channel family protein [Zobellia galactanivorans]CAZ96955.1 Small-conductance mechanosensitive channel [Zobellia galactanivorans]
MDLDKINEYAQIAIDKAVFYIPRIFLAGIILWIGFKVAAKVVDLVRKALERTGFSETLRPFLSSIVGVLLKGTVLFVIATVLGADLTGLFAILAAAAFAVGMALQGSLGNFASGILILTLKPFKVNDWIQVEDKFGRVVEIGIFSTDVLTPGNKILIIPNSMITESVVTNYSEKGMIRLELEVTMPYEESFPKVREVLASSLKEVSKILPQPEPEIGILDFDSHNVRLIVRPYVLPDDFWEVTFNANKAIKKAFSSNGVKVAYSEGVEIGKIGE